MSNCKSCEKESIKKSDVTSVPLASVESERHHRNSNSRVVTACFCLVLIALILCVAFCYKVNKDCLDKVDAMNKYWIDYISQYDFEDYSYEYTQDGKGLNIMGDNNGVEYHGSADSNSETDAETEGRQVEGQSDAP